MNTEIGISTPNLQCTDKGIIYRDIRVGHLFLSDIVPCPIAPLDTDKTPFFKPWLKADSKNAYCEHVHFLLR